jgi:hypothetical protein
MWHFRALETSSPRTSVFVTGCSENGRILLIAMASRNMTPRCWKVKTFIFVKLVKKSHNSCTTSRIRVADVWRCAQRYFIYTYVEVTVDAVVAYAFTTLSSDDT